MDSILPAPQIFDYLKLWFEFLNRKKCYLHSFASQIKSEMRKIGWVIKEVIEWLGVQTSFE
jgi:hypothetical protein